MDDNMGSEMISIIDLNREPFLDPSPPPPSPRGIEDRIRQLEAVSARARQSQRWRRVMSNPELSFLIVGAGNENQGDNRVNCKRDISQLAKALEMDSDPKKIDNGGDVDGNSNNGNFFDCNICLDVAKDPILTCCGHLFCWSCFYQVPYVDSISKECPVCKGEVTDSNITPIYGNGMNSVPLELESGVKVPPRPQAHRVGSARQLSFGREISHIPMADAIHRMRIGIGLIEESIPPQVFTIGSTSEVISPASQGLEAVTSGEGRQRSRVISESPASFPSVSSAINGGRVTIGIQSETDIGETNPTVRQMNAAATVLRMGALATDGSVEIDLTVARPTSSRRTRGVSSDLDLADGSSLEHRRRRFR